MKNFFETNKRRNKRLIREAITLSIDAIKDDITGSENPEENAIRAIAIKLLVGAFKELR